MDAWERTRAYRVSVGNLKERDHLQHLQDSVLSKLIFKKVEWRVWSAFAQSGKGSMVFCCEHRQEHLCSIKS